MNTYAGVLLLSTDREVILQERESYEEIINAGMVTVFGGKTKKDETPIQGARREIHEETNLSPNEQDLIFFKNFYKTNPDGKKVKLYIFLLNNVNTMNLEIYEGKRFIKIDKNSNLSDIKLSETTREILLSYFQSIS
jgi:8-oxo-dGTP pyrophosphatase MutT (NUDIX family)